MHTWCVDVEARSMYTSTTCCTISHALCNTHDCDDSLTGTGCAVASGRFASRLLIRSSSLHTSHRASTCSGSGGTARRRRRSGRRAATLRSQFDDRVVFSSSPSHDCVCSSRWPLLFQFLTRSCIHESFVQHSHDAFL